MKKKITTNNQQETFDFAQDYASSLTKGEVIGLNGDLGAGKTVFTKGLAKGLGVRDNVSSPTFVLMKVYDAKHKKIKKLCHIDAYRIKTESDLEAIGALEYFARDDAVVIVEWAEQVKKILPKKTRIINIEHLEEDKRKISLI